MSRLVADYNHTFICLVDNRFLRQSLSFFFFIRLQWVPGQSFFLGNDTVDQLDRRGALLQLSSVPCSFSPLSFGINSFLLSDRGALFHQYFSKNNFSQYHMRNLLFLVTSPVALQLRALPKVSARAPAHRSYHFRGVKLKSCIKKIHHNLYISKQANVRIKHADTEGASHKKFGTDARVQ